MQLTERESEKEMQFKFHEVIIDARMSSIIKPLIDVGIRFERLGGAYVTLNMIST